MAVSADVLGKSSDATHYRSLASAARPAFHKRFYNVTAGLYNGGYDLDAQTLTAAPLALGNVIPQALLAGVLTALDKNLASFDYHLTYGSVGAKHLLPQLSANGMFAAAMQIATQRTYPGFGHWLSLGATSCWESWNGFPDGSHPPQVCDGQVVT